KKGIPIIHHDPVPPEIDDATLPTLAEALDFLSKRAVVNVELKYDFVDRRALAWEAAKVIRSSSAEVIASSFDPRVLFWFAGRVRARGRAPEGGACVAREHHPAPHGRSDSCLRAPARLLGDAPRASPGESEPHPHAPRSRRPRRRMDGQRSARGARSLRDRR